jgi:hypothetical protein
MDFFANSEPGAPAGRPEDEKNEPSRPVHEKRAAVMLNFNIGDDEGEPRVH